MSDHVEEVDGLGSVPHAYYRRESPLTGVVLLPDQERHDTGEHPENVRRLPGVVEHLRASPEWEKLFVLYPRYARTEDALRSHDADFVDLLRSSEQDAPLWLDTDTRVSRDSLRQSLLASGAALSAVDAVAMAAYHQPDSLLALHAAARAPQQPGQGDGLLPAQPRVDRGSLCAGATGWTALRSSTGTSTTATAPKRSTGMTRRSCSCPSISGRCTPGPVPRPRSAPATARAQR